MYKCEREDEIMALLADSEYATVDYLVKKINISASSIRRDLKNLEERGLVIRSYGGVKLAETTGKHIPFSLRSHENIAQKKQMAAAAIKLLHPGETVFIDGSSTALALAQRMNLEHKTHGSNKNSIRRRGDNRAESLCRFTWLFLRKFFSEGVRGKSS